MLSTQWFSGVCNCFWGRTFILLALLLSSPPSGSLLAHESGHKHVLILHSYHAGNSWTDGVMAGMQKAFATTDEDIQLHVEYLDTKRYQNPEYFSSILGSILRYKLGGRAFDLVLLSDNGALNFALEHRDDLFVKTPIVFCGINNFKPAMISGFRGITGVAEAPDFDEMVKLAIRLHPMTEEIVVIGNTQNVTDRENRRMLYKSLPAFEDQVQFNFWDDLPVEELIARLGRLGKGSLVFINGSVSDQSGHVLPSSQRTKQIRQACSVPLYSPWDFSLGQGIVGGKLVSATMQGRLAGQLALNILKGENPDDIEVLNAGTNEFMFDYNELKRFDISLSSLPEDSMIINQPPPFYALSEGQLWGGFVCMMVLSGFLLITLFGRRKAVKALQASEAQVKLLLNSAAEGIYGLDLQGNCTFLNPAALRLFGFEDENDLLGKQMHALTHHTHPDGTHYPAEKCRICQAIYNDEGVHNEDENFWRADGSSFLAEYWSYPLREKKTPTGAVVSFLNITERKQAEERLKEANRELDAFVYTVSHDLRVPLTAIIGFTDLLKDECSQGMYENTMEMLGVIEKQGDRMAALIEDLLALATVGNLKRPDKPVAADEVVDQVLMELSSQLVSAGVTVQKGPLPELCVPETLLTQIFENLIGNAARYAGKNGNPIEVGGKQTGLTVRFYVCDHGPGVPTEDRSRIFEVFYRAATSKEISGTGVGLATVQKIARLYGGRAWVEETPGGGSTFWVEMEVSSSP